MIQRDSILMTISAYVSASFTITSTTMPPEKMIEILPFTPVKYWREGDTIGKSIIRRKHNGAVFSIPQQSVDEIEPLIIELLDQLEPFKHELIHLSETEPMDFEISCVVYFARPPSCNLSLDTIKRLAELRVALDLDLIPTE